MYASAWGAAFGFVGGRILGRVAAKLGPWLSKLHPDTGVRLLYGMFAANFAATGYGVYTAKTNGQGGFRGALGLMGLVANQIAINRLSEWARNLRNVDTLVLASTSRETRSMGVSASGKNVIRNNIDADRLGEIGESIPLVGDQADLPIPKGTFQRVVGTNVQVDSLDYLRTFKEWYRVMKEGGELTVSVSTGQQTAILSALTSTGFRNTRQLPGFTYPHGKVFSATR
jgi:hypothetical protein